MSNKIIDISTARAEGELILLQSDRSNRIKFGCLMILIALLTLGVLTVTNYVPMMIAQGFTKTSNE